MNVSFVNYDPFEQPVLVLKTAHGDTIGVIGSAENVGIDINYNEVSTIEFDITDRINGEVMPYYDQAVGMRIVELVDIGQFILMNPDEVDTGELRRKKCKCNSLEYEFTYKKITLPENTYRLWDPSGKEITVVSMIMEQMPSWRVEFVSESLQYSYRTFSVSNDNLYNFIKGTVQRSFGCVFEFDTFNRIVRIIDVNVDAETCPVLISHENLAKEIDIKENTDNLFTRLDVNGADGVDIRSVNPAGTNKLINLDYFMTKDNFSTALINKYNQWKQSWKNNITPYRYLTIRHSAAIMQKITEQSALLDLKNELTDIENEQAVIIQAIASGLKTQADLNDVNVRVIRKKEEIAAKENEIKNIERQIEDIISEMKAVQNQCSFESHFTADEMAILTPYIRDGEVSESSFVVTDNAAYTDACGGKWVDSLVVSITGSATKMTSSTSVSEIYDIRGGNVSVGNSVTGSVVSAIADIKADGSVVMSIRVGSGLTDGNEFDGASITIVGSLHSNTNDAAQNGDTGDYEISDIEFVIRDAYEYFTLDVSEYDKRSVSQDLMEYGIDVLERLAWPKYSFNVSLANFFAIKDFVDFKNQLRLGAKIDLVAGEDKALSPICTGISMNYNNPSSLTMRFGDTYSANDSKFSLLDLLEKSVSMGKNVDVGKFNYSSFVNSGAKTNIKKFMESALDVAKNAILSSGRQAITWDGAGFRLRKWANESKTAYDDEQIWMNNNSIMLTDDNWNTAKMAIGKFKDANLGDCWGVVAPMIVGTLIAGSELIIESAKKDGETSVFRMDGDGCRLYNSQMDIHNEAAHITLNPDTGIAIGQYPVCDPETKKVNENNANFWVDSNGNVHMRGTLHGANGEFTGRVTATELIIQSGNNKDQTIKEYIDDNVQIGGTNLLKSSKELPIGTTADLWQRYGTGATTYYNADGFYRMQLAQSGFTTDNWISLRSPLVSMPDDWQGREVTFSVWLAAMDWAKVDAGITWALCLSQGGTTRLNHASKYNIVIPGKAEIGVDATADAALVNGKWVRVRATWKLSADQFTGDGVFDANTHMFMGLYLRRNGDIRMYAPKLEFGNKATDWSPAPEDTDEAIAKVSAELVVQEGLISANAESIKTVGNTASGAITRVTKAEQSIDGLKGQIESKVSQKDFDDLGNIVAAHESAITQTPNQIRMAVESVRVGATNLLKDSKELTPSSESWRYWNSTRAAHENGFYLAKQVMSGLTQSWQNTVSSPLFRLPSGWQGKQMTFSAWIWSNDWTKVDQGITWALCLTQGGTQRGYLGSKYSVVVPGKAEIGVDGKSDTTLANNKWVRVSTTYTLDSASMPADASVVPNYGFDQCTHGFMQLWLRRNGEVHLYAPKLEIGNVATDWSPAPEDVDGAIAKATAATLEITDESITSSVTTINNRIDGVVKDTNTALGKKVDSTYLEKEYSTTTQTDDKIKTEVGKVVVGGRNYVLGTVEPYTATGTGSKLVLHAWKCASKTVLQGLFGKEVTVSFDYEENITSGSFWVLTGYTYQGIKIFDSNAGSGHLSKTFTLNNGTAGADVILYIDGTWTGSVKFSNLKMELGNKETDWTPAPEDTDADINEVRTAVQEITPEYIVQEVRKSDAYKNDLSSLKISSDEIIATVTSSETYKGTIETFRTQIKANSDAVLLQAGKKSGGTQLLKNGGFYGGLSNWSKMEYKVNGEYRELYYEPVGPNDYRANEVPNLVLHAQYETGMFGAAQVVKGLRKNTEYTISGYVASHRNNRACIEIRNTSATRWQLTKSFDVGWGGTNVSAYNRFEFVFNTGEDSDIQITLYSNNFQDNAYVWWAQIKLEEGNTATAWSAHPEEFRSGSNVTITSEEVDITTPKFEVNILSDDGATNALTINESGAVFQSVIAPNIAPRYDGPATLYVNPNATSAQIAKGDTFRSLVDALAKLSGRWIDKNIVIHVTAGITEYSTPTMMCVHGSNITIHGNGAKLVGGFGLYNGSANVTINNLNVDMTGSAGFNANNWTKLLINNCVITGTGSGYGVYSSHNAGVTVSACEIYDCNRSLYGIAGGEIDGYSCKGNCRVGANRSTLYLHDSMPCDVTTWATSLWAGQVLVSNISVDQGSKPTPIPAPTTVTYNYTRSDSYRGGWSYFDTDAPRQGFNGMDIYGTIWFDAAAIRSALSGKTIKQASLRLFMVKGVGRGRSVVVQLYGTNLGYDGRSGRPELTTSYGTIGTTEPDMNNEMTIPTAVINDIVSGRIQALVLKSDDTVEYKDKFYSENYARFEGSTSATTADNCPRLTVVYQ